MTTEWYKKHRPRGFKGIVGQTESVTALQQMVEKKTVPHTIVFTGPSGCGKTTLARILRTKLNCDDHDFIEINGADKRGIDDVRDIDRMMRLRPMGGDTRVWLIDEAHKLTNEAQNALLKMTEDTPPHVYFMLATTDIAKIIPTLQSRCYPVKVNPVASGPMTTLVKTVWQKEEIKTELTEEVIEKLTDVAGGNARRALVLLEQISNLSTEEAMIDCLQKADVKVAAIEIYKALVRKAKWGDIAKILKEVEEEPEAVRRLVLACATNKLLGGNYDDRSYLIICAFEGNFYDSGKAGLVRVTSTQHEGGPLHYSPVPTFDEVLP